MLLKDVAWRAMTGYDLPAVQAIAETVHPAFYESPDVLAERQQLYRNGCYLLELADRPVGYVLSHPWRAGDVPPLDTRLGRLPLHAGTYYLHDIALMPVARRVGAGGRIVRALAKHADAEGYPTISLVAVNGSAPFWQKHGFEALDAPDLYGKLLSYEDSARYMVRRLA